jgi:hypothetical protein
MPDEPEFSNWQEAWEYYARAELDDLWDGSKDCEGREIICRRALLR